MSIRRRVLLATTLLGLVLFVWQLGSSGLVDETPPLFAASARRMAESGDWLIPSVNGLPRYDKPPLVYWLMGLLYALPAQARWDPLGTWAARLPSALAVVLVMLTLAETLLRWPQRRSGAVTALTAALAFALSPLVLLWGRIAVSDALFSSLVAISLLLAWRRYAAGAGAGGGWWHCWLVLALAVLAKGPVAVLLFGLTLLLFGWLQADLPALVTRLRPGAGLALTGLLAVPWYGLALAREGAPFWNSFFGYHNLQRFTSVVNRHGQPWWYFLAVLVVASLPATPLLLLGLTRAIGRLRPSTRPALPVTAPDSLGRFAACWLLAVLLFFTLAATKLPSYWLPATPAAGLLIALAGSAAFPSGGSHRLARFAWGLTVLLTLVLAMAFLAAPLWVPLIQEPELPTLPAELLAARRLPIAGACFLFAALLTTALAPPPPGRRLLALQLPMVAFAPLVLLPSWALGDRLRGLPVRRIAAVAAAEIRPGESLAMVGILKPSLHFYSREVVIYEGVEPWGLVNLAERLDLEDRPGQRPSPASRMPSVLVVIDQGTAALPFWRNLEPQQLGREGLYQLWRLDRRRLDRRAAELRADGERPTWRDPVPERY